jgi:putative SOS response-associated peptidase YedK
MCGRYTLKDIDPALFARFGVTEALEGLADRFNVAPSQEMPVIVRHDGANHAELMRWGLIPFWSKEPSGGLINARSETAAEKSSFRRAFRGQRCIIPASGFFEWRRAQGGNIPYLIRLRDEPYFGFAGLFDEWRPKGGGPSIKSYAILTCAANPMMARIHHRMPCILDRADETAWLDPANTDPALISSFLRPYPAEAMLAYPVSRLVNAPANDAPQIVEPADGPPLDQPPPEPQQATLPI